MELKEISHHLYIGRFDILETKRYVSELLTGYLDDVRYPVTIVNPTNFYLRGTMGLDKCIRNNCNHPMKMLNAVKEIDYTKIRRKRTATDIEMIAKMEMIQSNPFYHHLELTRCKIVDADSKNDGYDGVIFTVPPLYDNGRLRSANPLSTPLNGLEFETALADTYIHAIEKANEYDVKVLAIPALSAGLFHCPADISARIAINTCSETVRYLDLKIVLVVYDDKVVEAYEKYIAENM